MQGRITNARLAAAGLFVLAGVGLGSLLSPLIGTALATVGQTVNISDHSSSALFAKVTSAGELRTNAVVSGKVALAVPPQPFSVVRGVTASNVTTVLGPTTATVALTDLTFANFFNNGNRELTVSQVSAAAPNTGCSPTRLRTITVYEAPKAGTVVQDFVTPIVLKPLASGDAWCLLAMMLGPSGEIDRESQVTLGGYVLTGTYTPPLAAGPAKGLSTMRKR